MEEKNLPAKCTWKKQMEIDKLKLISSIKESFKGVELRNGIGLSEANAIDDYADQQTRAACREKDEKQNWNAIPSSELNNYHWSLSFFDAEGMRFHLPAFLIADLKEEYSFGMIFALTHLSDYSKSQFELLSEKQREVTRLFLEHQLQNTHLEHETPAIKSALENYWSK